MANNEELIKVIAFEVGIISVSVIATFLIPGLSGILISGLIQLAGDLGLEFVSGGLPTDASFYITELLAVFGPYFQEIKAAKLEGTILRTAESNVMKLEKALRKIDDAGQEAIEYLKKLTSNAFNRPSGLTENLEKEVADVERQEIAREKLGTDRVKVKNLLNSFTPNTKNPESWIAGVGFKETGRFGPRDIRGDLIITYYINNDLRIGKRKVPMSDIVLGRTSGGETKTSNQKRYREVKVDKKPELVRIRKVVFRNARYYNDYLAFLKSYSWGGYYMRKWMVGVPGRKEGVNGLILFGSVWRVYRKLRALVGDSKEVFNNTQHFFTKEGKKVFNKTRLGRQYNKVTRAFSKANSLREQPLTVIKSQTKKKGKRVARKARNRNIGGK